ncbi:penicillin acylase family protein [Knoellia koreensis]|uniref:Penicillin acylase family protein n=1 Tax=Knoellia koreensis TaxID=2730921 RepID=A0A849HCA3_9MICO|nr:penicillin acylase family protein [Knoellia sp. DB2414S]NNM45038.1 penicillin acylase family protein [Knoellia sp. DB2414S]
MTGPTVVRDPWGVPQLWAPDVITLSRLHGWVTALDRAWQLTTLRWRSEGRMAQHLGHNWVSADVFARQARLEDTARRAHERLDDETRAWVTAYADGVTAGLAEATAQTPELAALEVEPEPWQPWTPLSTLLLQHVLFGSLPAKLWRDHVRRVSPAARQLLDAAPGSGDGDGPAGGSNAWAVAGVRSATGLPMVAGDPHRTIELPGVYQQVRLACPDFDVVGFAFAGVPGVPHFGHAGPVAWGITNAMADCHDVYVEDLRRSNHGLEARGPDGWAPADTRIETVTVAGGVPVTVEIVETARGCVVVGGPDEDRALSVRMAPRVLLDTGIASALALLRARSTQDVEAAWAGWVEPVNAVLTADDTGRVVELTAGRVPLRHNDNREGPVPAWEPGHEWTGWAEHGRAPVDDVAVHANHSSALTSPHGRDFASDARVDRIADLLAGKATFDVDDHRGIHMDTFHSPAPRLLARTRHLAGLSPAAEGLREELLAWDARMDADSVQAGRYAAWRAAVLRDLCAHPLLAPLVAGDLPTVFAPWMSVGSRVLQRLEALLDDPPAGFDVEAALAAGLEAAAAHEGTWGERHRLAAVVVVAPGEPPAEHVSVSGDRDCVLATSSLPDADDVAVQGPAARYVWDLSDRSRSRWVVPHGAVGRTGDPHQLDQQPLWLAGELVPVPDDRLGPRRPA